MEESKKIIEMSSVFENVLEKFDKNKGNKTAKDLMKSVLMENKIDETTAVDIIKAVSSTIDLIDNNYQSLKKAKDEGKSRSTWFKEKLDETIIKNKIDNPTELIKEIKRGLENSNKEIIVEIFNTKVDLTEPLKNPKFEGINKVATVKNFQNEIKNNTLLGAITFEKSGLKFNKEHKEIKAVKDYFKEKLDSPKDREFKKNVTTATIITKEKGLFKPLNKKTPEEISVIVDKGVTAAKVAYKVGKGELSPIDAVEYTIDRNVAILNSTIVIYTTIKGAAIGASVGAAIGSIFGPAGTIAGAAIGTVVGKVGGYVVGKVIGEGTRKVATAVKSVAKKCWKGVKSAAGRLLSKIKSVFRWF